MNAFLKALKSKTVWGAVIVQGAGLAALGHVAPQDIAHALGVVVATAGGRDAIDKVAAIIGAARGD